MSSPGGPRDELGNLLIRLYNAVNYYARVVPHLPTNFWRLMYDCKTGPPFTGPHPMRCGDSEESSDHDRPGAAQTLLNDPQLSRG
jgi:hypothetical protein